MRFRRRTRLAASSLLLAAALTGCGAGEPEAPGNTSTHTDIGSPEATVDQETLLELQDTLATKLGDAFVQGWIEDGTLHVATTDPAAVAVIEAAGATPHVVEFSAQQLRDGIARIMQWQTGQPEPIRTAIHAYLIDGRAGGLTLRVDGRHLDEVRRLLARDHPAGAIPLQFIPSSGIASPATG